LEARPPPGPPDITVTIIARADVITTVITTVVITTVGVIIAVIVIITAVNLIRGHRHWLPHPLQ
jgi:hypothetical protein